MIIIDQSILPSILQECLFVTQIYFYFKKTPLVLPFCLLTLVIYESLSNSAKRVGLLFTRII